MDDSAVFFRRRALRNSSEDQEETVQDGSCDRYHLKVSFLLAS